MENKVYSIKEAARLLGISPTYVYYLRATGGIRAERIGAQWVISHEEIERYKNSRVVVQQ